MSNFKSEDFTEVCSFQDAITDLKNGYDVMGPNKRISTPNDLDAKYEGHLFTKEQIFSPWKKLSKKLKMKIDAIKYIEEFVGDAYSCGFNQAVHSIQRDIPVSKLEKYREGYMSISFKKIRGVIETILC